MRRETELLLAFLVTVTMSTACVRSAAEPPDLSNLGPSSAATSTIHPVGDATCPGGGIGINTGSDMDGNGLLEASEVLKSTPVCGPHPDAGTPGGNITLVMVVSESTGNQNCIAGGLKVLSGVDANRNALLDPGEIALTEYLCNGTPGSGSPAGITVAVGTQAAPEEKKIDSKPAPAKKPKSAAGKAGRKSGGKPRPNL
jgi:hypothetical protein